MKTKILTSKKCWLEYKMAKMKNISFEWSLEFVEICSFKRSKVKTLHEWVNDSDYIDFYEWKTNTNDDNDSNDNDSFINKNGYLEDE